MRGATQNRTAAPGIVESERISDGHSRARQVELAKADQQKEPGAARAVPMISTEPSLNRVCPCSLQTSSTNCTRRYDDIAKSYAFTNLHLCGQVLRRSSMQTAAEPDGMPVGHAVGRPVACKRRA